tara:strand:- start:1281 stop:2075 length:795 start_codon:yes stop_codon:yes gene_type:complete
MKYFVFGSNGMMGKHFCSIANNAVQLTRKDYDILSNDEVQLNKMLRAEKGITCEDVILNFAGAIKQRNFSLKDYVLINSLFPHQLEAISKNVGCRLIHLTTDCVYDGLKGSYVETDEHNCTDWYGKSKSLGEPEDSCCIRTSIIGLGSKGNVSLLDWFINEEKNDLFGFTNHSWNGVTCVELSRLIIELIDRNELWKGTRHIFSDSVSKYELLKYLNSIFGLGKNLQEKTSETKCDRTLSSIHEHSLSIKSIEDQMKDLKSSRC